MPEHTPAASQSRGIYGFVVYLLFSTLFVLYVLWAFIPIDIFEKIGITELPNKYFALFVPILILTATFMFGFFIYPSITFIMTSEIDSIETITDRYAVKRCQYTDPNGILCDNKILNRNFEVNPWQFEKYCNDHQSRVTKMENFCDCVEKDKCMLFQDKDYIEKLSRKRNIIQNSGDMNIDEVSDILYGDH